MGVWYFDLRKYVEKYVYLFTYQLKVQQKLSLIRTEQGVISMAKDLSAAISARKV